MADRAMDLELGVSPVSNHASSTQRSSTFSYLDPVFQNDVDKMVEYMLSLKGDHDYETPFMQMNYIVWKLMPAVLMAQEESMATLVPIVEMNEEYNSKLAAMQGHFGKWGKEELEQLPDGTFKTGEQLFFDDLTNLETYMDENGAGHSYELRPEMQESVARIRAGVKTLETTTGRTADKVAWNAVQTPNGGSWNDGSTAGTVYDVNGNKVTLKNDESKDDLSAMTIMNETGATQPILDQTNKEMVLLQGMNTSMSQKVEMELKYKIEFYNSYISSTTSMEDNLSKQKRSSIDRLR